MGNLYTSTAENKRNSFFLTVLITAFFVTREKTRLLPSGDQLGKYPIHLATTFPLDSSTSSAIFEGPMCQTTYFSSGDTTGNTLRARITRVGLALLPSMEIEHR